MNSAPIAARGWGGAKFVVVTRKVQEPRTVTPWADPAAVEILKRGWVASAGLVLKVSVVGTAGKETAAPLASVPEKPVGNVMGVVAAVDRATKVVAVALF